MSWGLSSFLVLLLLVVGSAKANARGDRCQKTHQPRIARIGAVIDFTSRGNSAKSTAAAINLLNDKTIQAIIGTLTMQEVALVSEIDDRTKNFTVLSLTSTAINSPSASLQLPNFLQVANDIVLHMQCLAALVGHFQWRKVTAIYEQNNAFSSNSGIITLLSMIHLK
ncbi:hypothetical protein M0R45_025609 [Rubus argutus]|uniref:Receptor ligand binding region domain-containing protein n=1 Tax=Rubus argutus TaxID=59490 RepID=A0AAW1WWY3_RUBAR